MANIVMGMIEQQIREAVETKDVNEDWDRELQYEIPTIAKGFIDDVCAYLSNDTLGSCKKNEDEADIIKDKPDEKKPKLN